MRISFNGGNIVNKGGNDSQPCSTLRIFDVAHSDEGTNSIFGIRLIPIGRRLRWVQMPIYLSTVLLSCEEKASEIISIGVSGHLSPKHGSIITVNGFADGFLVS